LADPIPFIDEIFDNAKGKIFSNIDGEDTYHQFEISEECRRYTATSGRNVTPIEFNRLQYGLLNASNHCQESLDHALNDIKGKFVDTFIDDSLVWSNTVEQHAQHLEQV